jgi:hypothetical protein
MFPRRNETATVPRWVEVRSLQDPELRAAAERAMAEARELAQLAMVPPPFHPRDPRRLLCGCVDPEIGPSVVRADGSCCACSP